MEIRQCIDARDAGPGIGNAETESGENAERIPEDGEQQKRRSKADDRGAIEASRLNDRIRAWIYFRPVAVRHHSTSDLERE